MERILFKEIIKDKKINHKIFIVYLKNNMGPGIARNIGSVFSKAENLLFLDAGDICINNRISLQKSS